MCLRETNDDTLTPEDLAFGYKQLMRVVECWRTMKSGLRMCPVFHWAPHRIEAHIKLCVLALLSSSSASRRPAPATPGATWSRNSTPSRWSSTRTARLASGRPPSCARGSWVYSRQSASPCLPACTPSKPVLGVTRRSARDHGELSLFRMPSRVKVGCSGRFFSTVEKMEPRVCWWRRRSPPRGGEVRSGRL